LKDGSNMSTTSSPAQSQSQQSGSTIRHILIGALFALVLLLPKILLLRRNASSWMLFRILLGVAGAALVVLPLGLGNSYVLAVIGLAIFTASILLPPAKLRTRADEKARELGALVVVNGGRYRPVMAPLTPVQLFVGADRIWVLDKRFQQLLVIPVNEITAARAEESAGRWFLRIAWAGHSADFSYRGVFAEHLARVAASTVQSVMRPSLPVITRTRAAGA
jgi:hypothetical protein